MKPLTEKQLIEARRIAQGTKGTRIPVVLYKANDESLARFRVTAANQIGELIMRIAAKRPVPKKTRIYFKQWASDTPGGVGDLITAAAKDICQFTGTDFYRLIELAEVELSK